MLFSYPVVSHKSEKLHEYVTNFFNKIASITDTCNFDVKKLFHIDFQPLLERENSKIRILFEKFFIYFLELNIFERKELCNIFTTSNKIEELFKDTTIEFHKLDSLTIHNPLKTNLINSIKELFIHLYEKTLNTKQFDINSHYQEVYKKMKYKVCPFCGLEEFKSFPRPDYDHLLNKELYPFSAVNLRNLAPTCKDCNQGFKRTKSLLFDKNDKRRKAYFPYSQVGGIRIEVFSDKLPAHTNDKVKWSVNLKPIKSSENEEIETWKDVYNIENRYKEQIEKHYSTWLERFRKRTPELTDVNKQIALYSKGFEVDIYSEKTFLQKAFFEYLIKNCDDSFFFAFK